MKKITMQQIAEQVGVSKFAVSQALSGKPGVAEETRTKIVQAANELGYFWKAKLVRKSSPVQKASQKKSAGTATGTVIILMPNVRFQSRDSLFWGSIIDGVSAALAEREVGVMMVTENHSERSMKSINPEGVLGLIGIGEIANPLLLEIRHMGIPFVLVDHESQLIPSDTVFMNNYDCMRQLTSLLVQSGHRDIRFVGNPQYSRSFHDRFLGYRTSLEEAGLPTSQADDPLLQPIDNEYLIVSPEIERLASQKTLPSAFVCGNDFLAYLVMQALVSSGVKIPEVVSVTGFDHIEEYFWTPEMPELTTIHVPKEMLGRKAVEMLFSRLKEPDRPYEKALINGNLLVRASTRKE